MVCFRLLRTSRDSYCCMVSSPLLVSATVLIGGSLGQAGFWEDPVCDRRQVIKLIRDSVS